MAWNSDSFYRMEITERGIDSARNSFLGSGGLVFRTEDGLAEGLGGERPLVIQSFMNSPAGPYILRTVQRGRADTSDQLVRCDATLIAADIDRGGVRALYDRMEACFNAAGASKFSGKDV